MNEYVKGINAIIKDTIENIKSLEDKYTNDDKTQVETVTSLYINYLKNALSYENILNKLFIHTNDFSMEHDPVSIKIKSFDVVDNSNNNITHVLSMDNDPLILQMRNGKKIVLNEEPNSLLNKDGKEIILDHDPVSIAGTAKKFILDDEPALIKLKSGKKIVLDHDPVVIDNIKNNSEVMDDYFSYSGNNLVFKDDVYVVNVKGSDTSYVLDDKPGLFLNDMDDKIIYSQDYSNDSKIHSFTLEEDPVKIVLDNGHEFTLAKEPVHIDEHAFYLDHDPSTINIKVNGKKIVLDHDPVSISNEVHKEIILKEDPITIELEDNSEQI